VVAVIAPMADYGIIARGIGFWTHRRPKTSCRFGGITISSARHLAEDLHRKHRKKRRSRYAIATRKRIRRLQRCKGSLRSVGSSLRSVGSLKRQITAQPSSCEERRLRVGGRSPAAAFDIPPVRSKPTHEKQYDEDDQDDADDTDAAVTEATCKI